MSEYKHTGVANSVVEKFAVLISLWIVTELDVGDVTAWETTGSSMGYITFDAESFMFGFRRAGDELTEHETVMGVQVIDLHGIRDIANNSVMVGDVTDKEGVEDAFRELYIGQVLRFWMFATDVNHLLSTALLKVSDVAAEKCIRNIDVSFNSLVNAAPKGNHAEQVLELRKEIIADEYHDLGTNFLH